MVVDTFSKYLYTKAMKEISAAQVKSALKEIFRVEKPKLISTDQGIFGKFY